MSLATVVDIFCGRCNEKQEETVIEFMGKTRIDGFGPPCDKCYVEGVCDRCEVTEYRLCSMCDPEEKRKELFANDADALYDRLAGK